MLMKGIKPDDEGYGLEVVENLEIFFGKRPFPEVIKQKLTEAIEKRNLPRLVVDGGSSLARLGFGIQDFLVDKFDWNSAKPHLLAKIMNYEGKIIWDIKRPDGQPRRVIYVSKASKEFNFKAQTNLNIGLRITISWFLKAKNCS